MLLDADVEKEFLPVALSSFRARDDMDFDTYILSDMGKAPVLFQQKRIKLRASALDQLKESGHTHLFIRREYEDNCQRYLERTMDTVCNDDSIPMDEKTKILYDTTVGLMKFALDNPLTYNLVTRSRMVIKSTVEHLARESRAFEHLLKLVAADYATCRHSVDSCMIAIAFAQRTGVTDPVKLREFGEGMLLHDIGMGLINPKILHSRKKLSKAHLALIREHPVTGHQILLDAGGMGEMALDVVLHHHERWNGGGYPDGLRFGEISPFVRICIIADVFAALIAGRPHRRAIPTFEALKLMKTEMGEYFEPKLLDTFIRLMGMPMNFHM